MDYLFLGDAAATAGTNSGAQMLIFILIFAGMWLLLIAPNRKRQKQQQAMLQALKSGDHVLLNSGIFAKILKLDGHRLLVEISKGVHVEILRSSVVRLVEKKESALKADEESSEKAAPKTRRAPARKNAKNSKKD